MAKSYEARYSRSALWDKCKALGMAAGSEVIEKALWLYFVLVRPETPGWAKATVIGALGYFIFPIDAIPDIIPVLGYTDDIAMMAAALKAVSTYVDDGVKKDASMQMKSWGFT